VRWRIAVRHALCVVAIGFVIGFFEGASPNGDPAGAFRTWAAGNVAFTLAVAILFFAVATQSLTESLRQAFMTLGVYTLVSILIGLALSAWSAAPPLMVLIEWLLVVLAALVGTVAGAWVRTVRSRRQAPSASGR
jgi:hypothetical protein